MLDDNEGHALQAEILALKQMHRHGHGLIEDESRRMGWMVHANLLPVGAL